MSRAFLFSAMLATAPSMLAAQSPPQQVKVQSCAAADSLLGPMTDDAGAVVRFSHWEKTDTTLLIAGQERTRTYAGTGGEPSTEVLYTASYGGHGPAAYPHLNLNFVVTTHGPDAPEVGGDSVPVTMAVDGSPISLGFVKIAPTRIPNGSIAIFDATLSPNHSFVLAGAGSVVFSIGRVTSTVSARDLRDVRGMYRVALCRQGAAPAQIPTQCPRPDSGFTLVPADTLRGFSLPALAVSVLPPQEFRGSGEVLLLVDAQGAVLRDSTKIRGAASREDSLLLAQSSAGARFHPARYQSCPISAWFTYQVRH